jgi:hypothetical protein
VTQLRGDQAAPIVKGILCKRGHFNHPLSPFCSQCGIAMVHQTHVLVDGPRPSLGVLIVDDGTVISLDADYIIGREPERDQAVQDGRARALNLHDPEQALSRVHAAILIEDWDVKVEDRGSANGTFLAVPGQENWTRLVPHQLTTINAGTYVAVGQRTLVFDSHHRRNSSPQRVRS